MWAYAAKRLVLGVLIVAAAVTLLYGMIHMVPGDPVKVMLGPRATPEMKEVLFEKLGLNDPLPVQIVNFLGDVARGELGYDVFTGRPVGAIIAEQAPHTIILVLVSIAWAAAIGIPLGCYASVRRNTLFDRVSGVLTVACIAIPPFVVALCALLLFSVSLRWLPAIGAGERGDLQSRLLHLILPSFAVGIGWVGYIARLVRASMLEVLGENHVRAARAFGLREPTILFRYVLRIAVLPTITLLGIGIGILLSSAVFAEIVFARPGIGKLIYDAVTTRNYPVVMGSVLVTTMLFVLCTTLADLLNAALDPRQRIAR